MILLVFETIPPLFGSWDKYLPLVHGCPLLFQTLCLCKGIGGAVGGATPGKRMLGLKVVSCLHVTSQAHGRVLVCPAKDIGFFRYTFSRKKIWCKRAFGRLYSLGIFFWLECYKSKQLQCKSDWENVKSNGEKIILFSQLNPSSEYLTSMKVNYLSDTYFSQMECLFFLIHCH